MFSRSYRKSIVVFCVPKGSSGSRPDVIAAVLFIFAHTPRNNRMEMIVLSFKLNISVFSVLSVADSFV